MSPHARRTALGLAAVAVLAAAGLFALERVDERRQLRERIVAATGGDPEAGKLEIARYGCGGCHQIPGVTGARGTVGPPLSKIAGRGYIGGRLRNEPDNLIAWIDDPHQIDPRTAMPDVGVTPADARDIAAYLYTLE
jgi:cytochrome c